MPVITRFNTLSVSHILADETIYIPPHQRPEIWDKERKALLIRTIRAGLPLGMMILHETMESGKRMRWLEDGQQRYWSIIRYTQDTFPAGPEGNEKLYSELTPEERAQFNWYQIPVLTYENATLEERLYIFQYLQNGVPLTSGQRFHAMADMSPIVRYAHQLMPNERLMKIFGFGAKPRKDNNSKTQLQNVMAIAGGLCLGPDFITTSYDILGPELLKEVPAAATDILERLLTIYESAQETSAWSNAELKKYQWPVGKMTGYILWSLAECEGKKGDHDRLIEGWTKFLISVRSNRNILNVLHKGLPSSRNWTSERWQIGFKNIFNGEPHNCTLNDAALQEIVTETFGDSDEEIE
jgi:hypothetical protein